MEKIYCCFSIIHQISFLSSHSGGKHLKITHERMNSNSGKKIYSWYERSVCMKVKIYVFHFHNIQEWKKIYILRFYESWLAALSIVRMLSFLTNLEHKIKFRQQVENKKKECIYRRGKQIDENCDANNHKSLLSATTKMLKSQHAAHKREKNLSHFYFIFSYKFLMNLKGIRVRIHTFLLASQVGHLMKFCRCFFVFKIALIRG